MTKEQQLIEALEEIIAGAVPYGKQEHKITNWSLRLAKKALERSQQNEESR